MIPADQDICVVRCFQIQKAPNGEQIKNEYDCPLVLLTSEFITILPSEIIGPASVVHACSNTCRIIEGRRTRLIERETVELNRQTQLVYKHDISNKLYCINIFCTGNYFN